MEAPQCDLGAATLELWLLGTLELFITLRNTTPTSVKPHTLTSPNTQAPNHPWPLKSQTLNPETLDPKPQILKP